MFLTKIILTKIIYIYIFISMLQEIDYYEIIDGVLRIKIIPSFEGFHSNRLKQGIDKVQCVQLDY